jgi:hypothetical protein
MADRADAEGGQVRGGQPRQDLGINIIGPESLGVLLEPKSSQPGRDVIAGVPVESRRVSCSRTGESSECWARLAGPGLEVGATSGTRHPPRCRGPASGGDHLLHADMCGHALGPDVVLAGGLEAGVAEQVGGDADLLGVALKAARCAARSGRGSRRCSSPAPSGRARGGPAALSPCAPAVAIDCRNSRQVYNQ